MDTLIEAIIQTILEVFFDIAEGAFNSPKKSIFQRVIIAIVLILAQALTLFMIYACFARLVEGLWYAILIAVTAAAVAVWVYIFIKAIHKRKNK